MKKQSFFLASVLLIAALSPLVSIAAEEGETAQIRRVLVAEASGGVGGRAARFSGVTRASQRARLAFTLGGRLASRPVQLGDRVAKGGLLAKLDDAELEHAVGAARATLAELEARSQQQQRDRERVERLAAAKAATAEELESVAAGAAALEASVERARVGLAEAERRLGETSLFAPFDATVVAVRAEVGEHVAPGGPVIVLQGVQGLEVEIELPEALLVGIGVGTEVSVELPARSHSATGRVRFLSRAASGPGRLFPVVIEIDENEDILPGSTVEVFLRRTDASEVSVPVEAVIDPGGKRPAVFKVRDGKVSKVLVELGSLVGSRIELRGEIAAGDLVVVAGQRGLLDGDRVEILR